MIRAIVGARVSRVMDVRVKTSHFTQHESGQRYATAMGWTIVGQFEDLDISASISPWDRPDLGPWLNEKPNDWDALIFAKVDRAFRSIKDCSDVAYWAEQNMKILVFADDGIICNFRDDSDPQGQTIGKLFLMMTAMFAEMELKRFKGRNRDARKFLNGRDRWPGGSIPYGFKVIDHPEGTGKTLVQDPEAAEIVKMIGRMFLSGRSTYEIASYLTQEGFPTPRQHLIALAGGKTQRKREPSAIWNKVTIRDLLQNPTTMGYKVLGRAKNRKIARDEEGFPIRYCDGIFSEEEWTRIQGEVKRRGTTPERRMNASPLLGIVYCGTCNHRLYRNLNKVKGHTYVYYRCPEMPGKPACPAHGWREEYLQTTLDENMAVDLAEVPVTRKVFVPGEDHTAELQLVIEAMDGLFDQFEEKAFDFPGGDKIFKDRMVRLGERRAELEALPQRADTWIDEPTGETYAQAYERMDPEQRRLLLITAGVKVFFKPGNDFHVHVPRDLKERAAEFQIAEGVNR